MEDMTDLTSMEYVLRSNYLTLVNALCSMSTRGRLRGVMS